VSLVVQLALKIEITKRKTIVITNRIEATEVETIDVREEVVRKKTGPALCRILSTGNK
jgi:hypothetical protein